MLWLGGGARHAGPAVRRLLDLGIGVVTRTQGRGIVAEDDPRSLGAYHDPGATVQKPYTIRVDWLYRWSPENLSGRDVKLTPVTLTGHSLS